LTDDQFAECLGGEYPSPETQAHLACCEACRAEMNLFRGSVDDFSTAAMGWSKSQPVISPRTQAATGARSPRPAFRYAPLGWAMAAAVALAVGVPLAVHHQHADVTANVTAEDDSPAQIAQDNSLLQSVNVALGSADPSPLSEYRLTETKTSKSRPESRNE
jgi:anti-sigma factor RsiW